MEVMPTSNVFFPYTAVLALLKKTINSFSQQYGEGDKLELKGKEESKWGRVNSGMN